MSWFTPGAVLAQISKSEVPGLNSLPSGVNNNNVARGLMVAFGIAGAIAVIIMAYGGFKFVTSQGNPQEVGKAKNTIIDGVIGLVIIVLAGSIVGFVVSNLV